MKTIAYYISDYGFGHASRSIAVIRELLNEAPNLKIIICHSFALDFIKGSLRDKRVNYRKMNTDIGYFLKEDSIFPDGRKIYEEYQNFISNWDSKITAEENFLMENKVDLIISDITPIALEAAANLGIPSIGISNFTWYTAYRNFIDQEGLDIFRKAYGSLSYFFSLAGHKEPRWGLKQNMEFSFFARKRDENEIERIGNLVNPTKDKFVVFVGIGMKMNLQFLERLPLWDSPNCIFLVSSNIKISRPNIISIPRAYLESQNYIAASDLAITKAGWGTVSEAVTSNVPLLILDRKSMEEDQNTSSYLKQYNLCQTIDWTDFQKLIIDHRFIDEMQMSLKFRTKLKIENQVEKIAENVLTIMNKSDSYSKLVLGQ